MWFKLGAEIQSSAHWRELSKRQSQNDSNSPHRQLAFIMLLTETAEGRAEDLQNARDLARIVGTTEKQAQIVWDVCLKFEVLRPTKHGYGAKAWMIETGILGDVRQAATKTPCTPSKST